jgi:Rap1a immunity proteins
VVPSHPAGVLLCLSLFAVNLTRVGLSCFRGRSTRKYFKMNRPSRPFSGPPQWRHSICPYDARGSASTSLYWELQFGQLNSSVWDWSPMRLPPATLETDDAPLREATSCHADDIAHAGGNGRPSWRKGRRVHRRCYLRQCTSDDPNWKPQNHTEQEMAVYCWGYVEAAVTLIVLMDGYSFCLPTGATQQDVLKATFAFMQAHPEQKQYLFASTMMTAVMDH